MQYKSFQHKYNKLIIFNMYLIINTELKKSLLTHLYFYTAMYLQPYDDLSLHKSILK